MYLSKKNNRTNAIAVLLALVIFLIAFFVTYMISNSLQSYDLGRVEERILMEKRKAVFESQLIRFCHLSPGDRALDGQWYIERVSNGIVAKPLKNSAMFSVIHGNLTALCE